MAPQRRGDWHTLRLGPAECLGRGAEITGLVFGIADSLGDSGDEIKSGRKHVGAIGKLVSDAGSIPAASTKATSRGIPGSPIIVEEMTVLNMALLKNNSLT